jgi:hypothetical protein
MVVIVNKPNNSLLDAASLFKRACKQNKVNLAKLAYYTGDIDMDQNRVYSYFELCCVHGSIDVAKWIYDVVVNDVIDDIDYFRLLNYCCDSGKEEFVLWFLPLSEDLDGLDVEHNEGSFIYTCYLGNVEIAQMVHGYFEDVVDFDYQHAFINSCRSCNVEMVKWVYGLSDDINIRIDDDSYFKTLCHRNLLIHKGQALIDVLNWFCEQCPDYKFNINYATMCIKYNILYTFKSYLEGTTTFEQLISQHAYKFESVLLNDDDIDMCMVCLSKDNIEKMFMTNCNHEICFDCAAHVMCNNKRCPYCRTNLDVHKFKSIKIIE